MPPYMPLTADSCLVVYTVEDKQKVVLVWSVSQHQVCKHH